MNKYARARFTQNYNSDAEEREGEGGQRETKEEAACRRKHVALSSAYSFLDPEQGGEVKVAGRH